MSASNLRFKPEEDKEPDEDMKLDEEEEEEDEGDKLGVA